MNENQLNSSNERHDFIYDGSNPSKIIGCDDNALMDIIIQNDFKLQIPKGVTIIGKLAFGRNEKGNDFDTFSYLTVVPVRHLPHLIIPSSVKHIESRAFRNMVLGAITFEHTEADELYIENGAFSNTHILTESIKLPPLVRFEEFTVSSSKFGIFDNSCHFKPTGSVDLNNNFWQAVPRTCTPIKLVIPKRIDCFAEDTIFRLGLIRKEDVKVSTVEERENLLKDVVGKRVDAY